MICIVVRLLFASAQEDATAGPSVRELSTALAKDGYATSSLSAPLRKAVDTANEIIGDMAEAGLPARLAFDVDIPALTEGEYQAYNKRIRRAALPVSWSLRPMPWSAMNRRIISRRSSF